MQNDDWRSLAVFAYIDEPPFAKPGVAGQATGCDVDLAITALRAIGIKRVETKLTTFAELLPGVASSRWTICTPMFVTPERAALVAFSHPVWALNDGLIVPAANSRGLSGYGAVAASPEVRLGVVTGQVQIDNALHAGVRTGQLVEFATQDAAVASLLAGQIHAYASTAVGNRAFVSQRDDNALAVVEVLDSRDQSSKEVPVGAFAFAKRAVELRESFDNFLASYIGSLAHRERMGVYGLTESEIDPVALQR